MSCSTRRLALQQGCPTCRNNGRILLANLFPRGTAMIAALNSPGFCTFKNGICEVQFLAQGGSPTVSARILLANLLQSSRSTFSCGSFPSFFAFQEGIWDPQISALLGSPTVSGRFLLVLRECSDTGPFAGFWPVLRLNRTEWQSATMFVRSGRWVKTRPWLLPCVHWSTLSACISTADGIVTPMCLAVARLITSSSFMGRSTGKSPACTPVRILAMCRASCRAISTSLAP
jgi:hypothetical protein